jgi:protein SCO1/2
MSVGLAACGNPRPTDHPGRGIAAQVDPVARTITLDHEDIPGLMKAMTMTFAVAPGVELESIAAGSEVEFVLQEAGDALTVTRIEPLAP